MKKKAENQEGGDIVAGRRYIRRHKAWGIKHGIVGAWRRVARGRRQTAENHGHGVIIRQRSISGGDAGAKRAEGRRGRTNVGEMVGGRRAGDGGRRVENQIKTETA